MRFTHSPKATLVLIIAAGNAVAADPARDPLETNAAVSAAIDSIEALEYEIRPGTGDVLTAPNRAQNLQVTFDASGLRARPRSTCERSFVWGLETTRFGRLGCFESLPSIAPEFVANRVEYRHSGIVEWFVNRPSGIEHGYTLAARPEGEGELVVEVLIHGDLSAVARDGGIDFLAGSEVAVRYDKLVVFDAAGAEVPASLALDQDRLRIEVDDREATYPLTIDPVATTWSWFAEGNLASAYFGFQVATAGDVNGDGYSDVAIGAPVFDTGSGFGRAFVFHGSATGLASTVSWSTDAGFSGDNLGYSLSTAGDVNDDGYSDLIVGDPFFESGQNNEGRAFVFLGSIAGLSTTPSWSYQSNQAEALLGFSVSTCGDLDGDGYSEVAVGAAGHSNGQSAEGQVLVFRGGMTGLPLSPSWATESNSESASLGGSVAYAGDVNGDGYADLTAGAEGFDNGQTNEGRAYVYLGNPAMPSASPAWTYESNETFANFGKSVATAGDVNGDGYSDLVVGAPFMDGVAPSFQLDEGVVFVFHGSSSGLASTPNWTFQEDVPKIGVGTSVATAGDVNGDGYADLVTSAAYDDGNKGRAFLFEGSSQGLSATSSWEYTTGQTDSFTGYSVATAGDVNGDGFSDVIVGAHLFNGGQAFEGRSLVFHGGPSLPSTSIAWSSESQQANARHGAAVATAGDVDGDGYADVIVGAPDFDGGQTNEGRASLYLGSTSGPGTSASWFAESNQANAAFGTSVASAGDVDGDGYSDVIVGAPFYSGNQVEEGRAYLYSGSASGLGSTSSWLANGAQIEAEFGVSVATAGDVNGDGYADVLVGASSFDGGLEDEGRAFLYLGSGTGLSASAAWTADGDQAGADFGCSVSSAGDIDLDGYCDVVIGARFTDYAGINDGVARVFRGGAAGLETVPTSIMWVSQSGASFGTSVGCAGDVDGNGHSDVIVGAPLYDDPENAEGRAFVYLGTQGGLASDPLPNWFSESNQASAQFGVTVGTAGDVNGDGLSDVVVGAKFLDAGENNEGRAFVYLGTKFGALEQLPAWTAESNQASAEFGFAVGTAGDTNGDGFADLLVGAPEFDNGEGDEGRAFVYFGNGGDGIATRARSLRENGLPLPAGGASFSNQFAVGAMTHSAIARTDVRLEVEARPAGDTFDGIVTQTSPIWQDSNEVAATVGSQQLIVGPFPDGNYQWRARTLYRPSKHPLQPHGPWFHAPTLGSEQGSVRVRSLPPILALDNLGSLAVLHVRGDPLPPTFTRKVSNIGGGALSWVAEALPTGAWIALSPPFGSGLLPGDSPKSVGITLNPNVLPSGIHTGSVRFSSLDSPSASTTIPISLTIVERMFVPGDTLDAGFEDGYGDEESAAFEAVAGMQLKLTFPAVAQSLDVLVRIDDPSGAPWTAFTVGLGSKKVKKKVTLPESGLFTLRLEPLNGTLSPLMIATSRVLPASAASVSKTLKPKKGATTAVLSLLALPGAVLDLTLSKKKFAGAVGVEMKLPSGASFDLTSFTTTLANGDLVLQAVPLVSVGAYELLVSGYATDKETLKAKLTLAQPTAGSSIVQLP